MTKEDENRLIWECSLLNENPQEIDGNFDPYTAVTSSLSEKMVELMCGPMLGELQGGIKVYINDVDRIFYFVLNDEVISSYSFVENPPIGATTKNIWNNPKYKGNFTKVFVDYLLPTFKSIESDDKMTPKGIGFWKNLMLNYPKFKYYVKYGDNLIPVSIPTELDKYWKSDIDYKKYRFVVKL